MGVSELRPDFDENKLRFFKACSLHVYKICGTKYLRTFPIPLLTLCSVQKKQDLFFIDTFFSLSDSDY